MFNLLTLSAFDISLIIVWAIVCIIAIVVEFETANLVSIWFAAGAITAMICAIFKQPIWLQIILFVVITGIFVLATRPFVKKLSDNQTIPTNVDRFIGKVAKVTKTISNGEKGEVKIDFQLWQAISKNESDTFNVDDTVVITDINGNKLIVESIHNIKL